MPNNPTEEIHSYPQTSNNSINLSSIEDDLAQAAALLKETIRADWVSIIFLNSDRDELNWVYECGAVGSRKPILKIENISNFALNSNPETTDKNNKHQQSSSLFNQIFIQKENVELALIGISEPIPFDNHSIGILSAARLDNTNRFSQSDWQTLSIISSQIGLQIKNQQLVQQEKNAREQAETLREVALALNSSLDLQTVLEMILDQLDRVVGYDSASILLISDDKFKIVAYRKQQVSKQSIFEGRIADYSHIQQVYEKRKTMVIGNALKDGVRWSNLPESSQIHCWLGVPLIGKDSIIGLISLNKKQNDYYSEEKAILASAFANQAAIALENARYYTFVQSQLDQLDALRETIADISTELKLPKLLEAILKRAVILLNAKGGDLGLYDEHEDVINVVACYQMIQDSRGIQLNRGEGAMGVAVDEKKPVIVKDYSGWQYASDQYPKETYHSVIAVPFMIGEKVIGCIAIMSDDLERIFSKDDEYLLKLFAQHAAIAVENARLYENAHEAAERRAILHQASQQIVGIGFEQEGVFLAIHEAAAQLMPAEAFVITVYDETTHTIIESYLIDYNIREEASEIAADEGLSGIIIRNGKSILINDLSKDPIRDQVLHFGDGDDVRSILAVPMRWRGRVTGMISAQSYQPYAYNSEDTYLLEMLASYAGIALENTHLFQHIQQLATIDPVAEIANRRHLFDMGYLEFARANRFKRALSIIMIDIDNFKRVNDRYGHSVGDQVLGRLGKTLRAEVREVDVVGRYGGEEFTIILPETNLQTALEIAERLHRRINTIFSEKSSDLPHITVSIGVADNTEDVPDFASLVALADQAMYAAKGAGRNQIKAYSPAHS